MDKSATSGTVEEHGTNPIFYEDEDHSVVLLDIPASIAASQDLLGRSPRHRLFSSPPLGRPFPSHGAGSHAKRRKLTHDASDLDIHRELWPHVEDAVRRVRDHHAGEWCHPRAIAATKRRTASTKDDEDTPTEPDHQFWSRLSKPKSENPTLFSASSGYSFVVHSPDEPPDQAEPQPYDQLIINPSSHPASLLLPLSPDKPSNLHTYFPSLPPPLAPTRFRLPPSSTILFSTIPNAPLLTAALAHLPVSPLSRSPHFDLLLLDPPWPNASARRARAYHSQHRQSPHDHRPYTLDAVRATLRAIGLRRLLAPRGCLAVWVTNKPAVRAAVLGDAGLFPALGLRLVEEWVWVKVTASGDYAVAVSISQDDDGARRPYECLLIARAGTEATAVTRRVLVAVPDLHSRKPSVKGLAERWLLGGARGGGYNAMEIFARNATAGWWVWGDEALRFNWEGWWEGGAEDGVGTAEETAALDAVGPRSRSSSGNGSNVE